MFFRKSISTILNTGLPFLIPMKSRVLALPPASSLVSLSWVLLLASPIILMVISFAFTGLSILI